MGIGLLILLVIVMGLLAYRKGYNPALWCLAGGVIGLLFLAFLPYVNDKSELPEEERAAKKKKGNIIGGVISVIAVIVMVIRATSVS